jgi:hypothetical protein
MSTTHSPAELQSWKRFVSPWKAVLLLIVVLVAVHVMIVSIGWNNPILEQHGFRQTQTAISSYWLLRGSPLLAYETPVMGPPWSIPFEFPLYQAGVALWSKWTHMQLDQSGRTASLLCFYICLLWVGWLMRRLQLPAACFATFSILYLTSPLYLFWSRTFMIETTALTLSVAYLAVAWVAVTFPDRRILLWSAAVLGSLAAIVKVTTFAGPIMAVCIGYLLLWLRTRPPVSQAIRTVSFAVVLPVGFELWWVRFSDATKMRNPLQFMTSSDLVHWNFGSPLFRVSRTFWSAIVHRMLPDLLGVGWAVVVVICIGLWLCEQRKVQIWTGGLAAVFWIPTVIFANLHFVHNYYQCGTAAYLYMGVAILTGVAWQKGKMQQAACIVLLTVLALGNGYSYYRRYYPYLAMRRYPLLEAAKYVRANLAPSDVMLVYGSDWDPTVAYYSGRRAIMDRLYRPLASAQMREAMLGLSQDQHVGSVVACGTATQGWYLSRVQQSVAALGLRREPTYNDGECQVYTGPPVPAASGPSESSDDDSWLRMPEEANPLKEILRNPALQHVGLMALASNPFPLAPTEGPDNKIAVLANPNSALAVNIPSNASSLTLNYGIKPFAWQLHHAAPVEFAAEVVRGADNAEIWRKALDPGRHSDEIGEQVSTIPLPMGSTRLILTTRSPDQSVHQRSYWSGIQFH